MKINNKGKVHPSPSSSSSSCPSKGDYFSILKLLPAAILALVSVLSPQDREVLAYMITRSLKTTTTTATGSARSPSSSVFQNSKKGKKRSSKKHTTAASSHKLPVFECDCFECYTSYWFRWDSSPNRELIHQAIEAFEEHLNNGEAGKSKRNGKRKDKSGRQISDKPADTLAPSDKAVPEALSPFPENEEEAHSSYAVSGEIQPGSSRERVADGCEDEVAETASDNGIEFPVAAGPETVSDHKGLARKVLPDVLGLFNSRLWRLWNPNV